MFGVAACVTAPSAPLYSPISTARSHGFLEEQLSDSAYRITYVAPRVRTSPFSSETRDRDHSSQLALAYDFALWRAADLAVAAGYPAFQVTERTNNVDYENYYDDFYYPYYPYGHHGNHRFFYPYRHYGPYGSYTLLKANVTLLVAFGRDPVPGAIDARAVIDRMASTYPGAQPTVTAPPQS